MVIFDANMILRYLLNDSEEMVDKAKQYLLVGDVKITIEVVAEVVYVLKGVYKLDRQKIAEKIVAFLELVECNEREVLYLALSIYGKENLDFVDCVLYAYNQIEKCEIATFDKKLLQLLENVNR